MLMFYANNFNIHIKSDLRLFCAVILAKFEDIRPDLVETSNCSFSGNLLLIVLCQIRKI